MPAGRGRAQLLARARRDDPARQGVRRAARLRQHPRRNHVRHRLRGRRGPPVLHGRAAQRRPRASCRLSPAAPSATASGPRHLDQRRPTRRPTSKRQFDNFDDLYGSEGQRIQQDVREYVAGVKAYIGDARLNPLLMPGEYAAIGRPTGPEDWSVRDVVATASVIGAIFGKGGGSELESALALQSAQRRFGAKRGKAAWTDFRVGRRPRGARDRARKSLPVPAAAQEGREGQPGDARPGVADQDRPEVGGTEGRRRRARTAPGAGRRAAAHRIEGLQRTAGVGEGVGIGQAAGRVRPAGRPTSTRRS